MIKVVTLCCKLQQNWIHLQKFKKQQHTNKDVLSEKKLFEHVVNQ